MNLREFFKKLRSPLGTSLLFLAAIVTLTFSAVPFLIREDAGTLQVVRSESGEASFNIPGKAKAISAAASAERQVPVPKRLISPKNQTEPAGRCLLPTTASRPGNGVRGARPELLPSTAVGARRFRDRKSRSSTANPAPGEAKSSFRTALRPMAGCWPVK